MFDRVPPQPIFVKRTVPNCLKEVSKGTIVFWREMWLARSSPYNFYCAEGKREVDLNNPVNCMGCPFNGSNHERSRG